MGKNLRLSAMPYLSAFALLMFVSNSVVAQTAEGDTGTTSKKLDKSLAKQSDLRGPKAAQAAEKVTEDRLEVPPPDAPPTQPEPVAPEVPPAPASTTTAVPTAPSAPSAPTAPSSPNQPEVTTPSDATPVAEPTQPGVEAPPAPEDAPATPAPQPADMENTVEAAPTQQPETEEPPAPAVKDEVEEIVVTGTRIRTNPLDAPSPILRLSAEEIERTGLTSVSDILQRLPVSGGALNTKFNSSGNFGFPPDGGGIGAGAAQVDLRYLGSKRVLVLVDGVRWVNGSSASGVATATDLNTIPVSIIERVEVLEDGASAIYGSDAIAGVVNIITKKEVNTFEANLYQGGYHLGDGYTQKYDLTWGNKTDDLTMLLNLSFVDQGSVSATDRDIAEFPTPSIGECTPNCSSGTPQGRFYLQDPNTGEGLNLTINDGVGGMPYYDPANPTGGDFHEFTTTDRFNYAPYNYVLTPSQRFGFFSGLRYKLTENIDIHVKALFNNRYSKNQAAPEPLFIGPEAGNGNRLDTISIDVTNPYNPFGFTLDANTNPYFIGRRPLEAGPRIFEQNVDTWYVSGGLHGRFAVSDATFYWDSTLVYSRNRADQIKRGAFNSAKLQKALGPIDECLAEPGCVPFNIFGGQGADGKGTITKEMLDYVTFVQKDVSQQELFDFNANISGELFELPGGMLAVAAGLEHRVLNGYFIPDSIVVSGDSAGVPSSPVSGQYYVTEGYGEIVLPLLSEMPAFDRFDVTGAVRVSRYSTFGTEETYKVGARWRPIQELLLRFNYAQGFRAPGIGELYGPNSRYDQTLNDPCSNRMNPANYPALAAGASPEEQKAWQRGKQKVENIWNNCATQGIPTDYEQINPQISITTGGNRDLQPEQSESIAASLVFSPSWLVEYGNWADQLDLELTFYWIELEEAIQALDGQIQIDSCYQTLDPALCDGIKRTANGTINGFSNQLINIGGIETYGLDVGLTYTSPKTTAGRFRLNWLSSILLGYSLRIPLSAGFQEIDRVGKEIGDPEQAFPKFKFSLSLVWVQGPLSAVFTTRYIHSVEENCRDLEEYPNTCSDPEGELNHISARVYNDIQISWTPEALDNEFVLTLGVNNLFNQDPPPCYSCALNGFDATTYEVPGMYGYLKAGIRM